MAYRVGECWSCGRTKKLVWRNGPCSACYQRHRRHPELSSATGEGPRNITAEIAEATLTRLWRELNRPPLRPVDPEKMIPTFKVGDRVHCDVKGARFINPKVWVVASEDTNNNLGSRTVDYEPAYRLRCGHSTRYAYQSVLMLASEAL